MAPVLVHTCPYKERKTHNVVPAYKRPQLSGNGCTLRPTCKKEKRKELTSEWDTVWKLISREVWFVGIAHCTYRKEHGKV